MTTLTLTDEDAEKFILFQKHYALFSKIDEVGAFEVKFGKVIFNIAFGEVQNIVKEEVVYKK